MIKTSLGDFIDFRNGKSSPDRTPEGEFDVFGSNGVIGQCEEKNASEFSLIIGRVGSYCGSVYQSKKACWVTDNAIIGALRNKDESNFWYFLLTRLDINAMSSGSGQPLINQKILKNIQVRVPLSSSTRVDIGNYLSLFNEKIKVNDDINQTLEQMAQALFKSWFVDFEPVKAKIAVLEAGGSSEDATLAAMTAISGKDADALAVFEREHPEQYAKLKATAELFPSAMQDSELGEIPEEWSVASISDMGKITCGKTPSKKEPEYFGDDIPFIKIPDMHGQLFVLKTNEYLSAAGSNSQLKKLVPANSICVSCIATIGVVSITNEPSHTNQQINSVTPHKSSFLYYIYFCMLGLKDYLHVLGSAGSATLNVNTSTFSGIKIAQPDDKVLDLFHAKCTHLFNEIKSLSVQTESLAQLRDTLLPKLLSGEITLPQAEQAVSEAENV
ncbi:EcoKI restriction-modification system protein HsdS [Yersinia enterocolitica]|nr:EcoKI restriction-modification system protein HsdS [Yersinia enterocolitica]CRX47758.1 EcoKI restriction-modification system protein HsdS [Yersinia enterocolitica]